MRWIKLERSDLSELDVVSMEAHCGPLLADGRPSELLTAQVCKPSWCPWAGPWAWISVWGDHGPPPAEGRSGRSVRKGAYYAEEAFRALPAEGGRWRWPRSWQVPLSANLVVAFGWCLSPGFEPGR